MGPFKNIIYANNRERQISSWYNDCAYFVSTQVPWFSPGGAYDYGSEAGMFAFSYYTGSINDYITFRIVLMP